MVVHLYYTDNNKQFQPPTWEHLLHAIPSTLRDEILRYHRWQDRQARLLGKLLLKEGIRQAGYEPEMLSRLQLSEHKRPFLPIDLDFNISHSGVYVVCAFSETAPIGIDIEEKRPVRVKDFLSVLCPEEIARLQAMPAPEDLFFHIWTKKEAAIKAEGKGFYNALTGVNALGHNLLLAGTAWHLREINLHKDYICHLAAAQPFEVKEIRPMTFK